jgi:hypothetical protein
MADLDDLWPYYVRRRQAQTGLVNGSISRMVWRSGPPAALAEAQVAK